MTTALKTEKGTSMREPRIFAYGFDAAGFSTHRDPVFLLNVGQIEFIEFLASGIDAATQVTVMRND